MNFYLERMPHQPIPSEGGSHHQELLRQQQNNLRRMTNNADSFPHLAFMDNNKNAQFIRNMPPQPHHHQSVQLIRMEYPDMNGYGPPAVPMAHLQPQQHSSQSSTSNLPPPPPVSIQSPPKKKKKGKSSKSQSSSKNNGASSSASSGTGQFPCTLCTKRFSTKWNVKVHYEAVHLQKRFKCDYCNAVFSQPNNLFTHKKNCRNSLQAKPPQQSSPKKGKKAKKASSASSSFPQQNSHHRGGTAGGGGPSSLTRMDYAEISAYVAAAPSHHHQHHHQGHTHPPQHFPPSGHHPSSSSKHNTGSGGGNSQTEGYVKNTTTGQFHCTSCEKKFSTKWNAKVHFDAIHLQKKLKCEICNVATFTRPNNLYSHKKACRAQQQLATGGGGGNV